jgi:hypothetical protein
MRACHGWRVVKSADGSAINNQLYGVAPSSGNTLWAVGSYEKQTYQPFLTLAEQWNGTSWTVVPTPNAGSGDNDLYGVAAVSAGDAWAVGQQNASPTSQPKPLIEQWDGSAWQIVASPSAGQLSSLAAVVATSANDVWAVGAFFNSSGNQQTLIEHWNGSKWSIVASPNPGASYNALGNLVIVSPKDIWATGSWSGDSGSTAQTLVEHWNGKRWSVVSSPNAPGSVYNFLGGVVAVSARDVWTVGQWETAGSYATRTLIERWNGTQWSIVSSPNVGSGGNALSSIATGLGSDLWAVGSYFNTASGINRTLIERWNGATWTTANSPDPGTTEDQLRSVTSNAAGFWAVGTQASGQEGESLVEFHC